ncbi:three-helix bundle dimerization domain-containing protein [Streptomyces sp. NPDC015492]|uniref:three-helix bundle dimerization domain-containing protein n=1 Tax=Streptomyces sp. NPDC015492 TaxID=3364958 RepID=UPI0036FF2CEC
MATRTEDADLIGRVTDRLMRSHPEVAAALVSEAVQTAYEELRYARVRDYLPVLMERRADDLLPSGREPGRRVGRGQASCRSRGSAS